MLKEIEWNKLKSEIVVALLWNTVTLYFDGNSQGPEGTVQIWGGLQWTLNNCLNNNKTSIFIAFENRAVEINIRIKWYPGS